MTFNPSEHLIKIKTKRGMQDYLNVQARLMWFRDVHPHGVITTELAHLDLDRQIAVFKAHVEDGQGGIGEGYGSETFVDFPDYIEKASTKAVGRALLALGFGTCFAGDELDEEHRIVDAPVDKVVRNQEPRQMAAPAQQEVPIPINAPTPRDLLAKFKGIGQTIETAQKLTFKGVIKPLDDLTPEECLLLKKTYDGWKVTYDERAKSA